MIAYTDMMLDFSINYNKNQIVNVNENIFIIKVMPIKEELKVIMVKIF